ncbi:SOS response-associated peptidase [Tepidamorphus sp. 3E244]|uniref:SOS response-associated peptidase n=1 Tax=Tepidamorphus sp. 3E244 TaxID=3385498 RepID=UPI0038FCB0E8
MCGRYLLRTSPEEVRDTFGYAAQPNFPPRYNIAPTQPIPIVREDAGDRASPEFALVRWGLLPPWVKDIKDFPTLINARSEEAANKPAFRTAMRRRRCLIPADGFYEWQKAENGKKQPYLIQRPDAQVFAFAGLWETWMDAQGNELESAAILTTAANETLTPLHHRMPVVIEKEDRARWLHCDETSGDDISDLLKAAPEDYFRAFPVSTRVNSVANDDESLVVPLADEQTPAATDKEKPSAKKKPKAGDGQMSLF